MTNNTQEYEAYYADMADDCREIIHEPTDEQVAIVGDILARIRHNHPRAMEQGRLWAGKLMMGDSEGLAEIDPTLYRLVRTGERPESLRVFAGEIFSHENAFEELMALVRKPDTQS